MMAEYIMQIEAYNVPITIQKLVRCRDCKHRDAEEGFCEGRGWPMQLVPDYGFCDKGERSEDEQMDDAR